MCGLKRRCERNLATSVDVDEFPFERRRGNINHGDLISIGAYPLLIRTVWQHSIVGQPVQRRQLAIPWHLSRVRMKNTWEAKWERSRQSCTTICRVKKAFGRTDEARGGDDVASGCEFFKGALGEHFLKQLRIINFLARSRHHKAVGGTLRFGINWLDFNLGERGDRWR